MKNYAEDLDRIRSYYDDLHSMSSDAERHAMGLTYAHGFESGYEFAVFDVHVQADPQFETTYRRLEAECLVDGWGGSQCRRLYEEWRAAGRPADVESFIRLDDPWLSVDQEPGKQAQNAF